MDNQPQIPQGQAAIGGMDDIRMAMQRRGMGIPVSPLNQVSPTAPSAATAATPSAAPQTSAMPMNQPPSMGGGQGSPLALGSPESTIIIKAMDNRLKMLGQQGK